MAQGRVSRYARQKQKQKGGPIFAKVVFYLAVLSFSGVIVYALFFSYFLSINETKISGNGFISADSILEEVKPFVSGEYLGFLRKDNLLLVSSRRLESAISSRFPLVRKVEIRKNFPHSLEIHLEERIPSLVLCEKECFILDENGQIYDAADNVSSEDKDRYGVSELKDENRKDMSVGQVVLDAGFLEYLAEVRRKIPERTEAEVENSFWTPALISNDIRARTKEGWGIYLNRNIDLEKEIEVLRSVLKEKITQKERDDLEYIDLRIDNKVYYKFRESTASEEARLKAEEAAEETESAPVPTPKEGDKEKKKN